MDSFKLIKENIQETLDDITDFDFEWLSYRLEDITSNGFKILIELKINSINSILYTGYLQYKIHERLENLTEITVEKLDVTKPCHDTAIIILDYTHICKAAVNPDIVRFFI